MVNKTPIRGESTATVNQLVNFVRNRNSEFNEEIARAFLAIAPVYEIRGDIAFCQSIHETNWFRFTGDVSRSQNNFAGIGAIGGGSQGNSFATIEEGVRAQIQHLYAYATTSAIPNGETLVDPRFNLVKRGSAPYWEDLAGKWAFPGYNTRKYHNLNAAYNARATYGQQIVDLYNQLLLEQGGTSSMAENTGYPEGTAQWKIDAVEWLYENGFLTSDEWKQRIEEPLPLWAQATVYNRLMRDLNGGDSN